MAKSIGRTILTMAAALACPTSYSSSALFNLKKQFLHSYSYSYLFKHPIHTSPPITPISKSPLILNALKPSSPTVAPLRFSTTLIDSDLSTPTSSSQSLKARLKNGGTLYGLFLLSFSPALAEIAGLAGYDYVVVDMEHGHGGIADALHCLHALAATSTPAILRLPECCPTWAKKALDLGPQGVMFPMIDSPELACKAVSYCRFPPKGVRGSAHTVVRASGYGTNAGYLSNYEEELLIMCQVESEDGVKNIEEIVAVEGVDCIQMGPRDLSASMGYLSDPGNKKLREVLRAAEKAVLGTSGGPYLAGIATAHDSPENLRLRGYHMVASGVDVGMFRTAAVEDVKKFKTSSMEKGSDNNNAGVR